MSIETLKNRLLGALDVVPPSLVPNIVNDALLEIYGLHDWGFLRKQDFVRTPAVIDSGNASVTKFSTDVILDSTATAIIRALSVNEIPMVERQFRTFTPRITGRSWLYNITNSEILGDVNATGTISFIGNASTGNTVTINGVLFTILDTPILPNDVQLGADSDETATNLFNKLTASTNPLVSIATYLNNTASVINITYSTFGTIGNAFTLVKVGTNIFLSSATLTGGATGFVRLTIDPYFLDDSNSAVRFQILKVYYNPPTVLVNGNSIIDFNGWDHFISLRLQRRLNTSNTLEQLNSFDPARFRVDEPRHVVPHPYNSDGNPLFELYPAPRFERVYRVIYRLTGRSLLLFDDDGNDLLDNSAKLPGVLTEKFVLDYCKYALYQYAIANADKLQLKSVGRFGNLMALLMNKNDKMSIPNQLEMLIKKDEENYPKAYLGDYTMMPYADSLMGDFTSRGEFDSSNFYGVPNTVLIEF